MSLDKAIKHGKEKRKPYSKSKAIDRACCNHGSCKWCEDNRTVANRRREEAAQQRLRDLDEIADRYYSPSCND